MRSRPEFPSRARKNNYSWNISAVLISLFCPSSCCQACLPTIVRPILCLWKFTLKMFFNSPELNRSVIFSLYFLRMSKKMDYFLRNLVRREREIPWFNNNPLPLFHRNDARWIINRFSSLRLCFLPLIGMQNPSPSVATLVLQADLQELLFRCCSIQSQIYLIHEKFWARIECCLHSKTRFWFQFHVCRTDKWS